MQWTEYTNYIRTAQCYDIDGAENILFLRDGSNVEPESDAMDCSVIPDVHGQSHISHSLVGGKGNVPKFGDSKQRTEWILHRVRSIIECEIDGEWDWGLETEYSTLPPNSAKC